MYGGPVSLRTGPPVPAIDAGHEGCRGRAAAVAVDEALPGDGRARR
jgi:hypothetical protein